MTRLNLSAAQKPKAQTRVSIHLADGTSTPPVDLGLLRQALDQVNRDKGKPKMKDDTDFNRLANDAYSVTADELRQFIERFEQLEAEKSEVANQMKEVIAEAKGRGYDTKILRRIMALRKRKPDDIAEEEAVLEMYKTALGMN